MHRHCISFFGLYSYCNIYTSISFCFCTEHGSNRGNFADPPCYICLYDQKHSLSLVQCCHLPRVDLEEEPEEVYSVMLAISINSWQSLNKADEFYQTIPTKQVSVYLSNEEKSRYSKLFILKG